MTDKIKILTVKLLLKSKILDSISSSLNLKVPTKQVGYVKKNGVSYFMKTKKRQINDAIDSILIDAFAFYITLKLFLQNRKVRFSILLFDRKFSDYFNNSHFVCFQFNNIITKIYANIYRPKLIGVIRSRNILQLCEVAFLKVEEKQKNNLQIFKHLKYVKQKSKKNQFFRFFLGIKTAKVFS